MRAIPLREMRSIAELRLAIETMSKLDRIRLLKKARVLATGTGMEPDDLFQEAVARSLEKNGGRNCPHDVNILTFLGNVMRSIASHSREKWERETPLGANEDDEDDPFVAIPDPGPSPVEVVIGRLDYRRTIARIEAMFDEDPQAQAIVIGIMEDWSPHEICALEPMSKNEYGSARKRVRRKLLREFPKGPTHE